jgi:hypothetical protein
LFFETFNIDRNMKEYATYEKEDYHFKDMEWSSEWGQI